MSEYPQIMLRGSEGYWEYYRLGAQLDNLFPNQCACDFIAALCENESSVPEALRSGTVVGLVMFQEGANDEETWIWGVELTSGQRYVVEGSCDYTGWDCQSSIDVLEVPSNS